MSWLLIFASLASVIPFGNSMTVTAHVKYEVGNPAAGAIVKIRTDRTDHANLVFGLRGKAGVWYDSAKYER